MHNWSTDEKKFKKVDPEGYCLWRLTQLINYGLDGEKLSKTEIKKYWPRIKAKLDLKEKSLIEFFLWQKPYLPKPKKYFWEK